MSHFSTERNSAHIGCWGPLVLFFLFWGYGVGGIVFGLGSRFSRFAPLTNMQSLARSTH